MKKFKINPFALTIAFTAALSLTAAAGTKNEEKEGWGSLLCLVMPSGCVTPTGGGGGGVEPPKNGG